MDASAVQRAFDAFTSGKKSEASAICDELVRNDPHCAPALMLLGMIADQENRFDDAVSLLERSVAVESHPWSLVTLAGCLWRVRRLDEAVRYAERTVAEHPAFPEGHLVLANLMHGMRDFDDALVCAMEAKALMPQSHLVEARLGCIASQMGRYEDAMRHFGEARRLMPKFVHYRLIDYRRKLWEQITPDSSTPVIAENARPDGGSVVATFCDATYFYKYGPAFLNSFVQNAARSQRVHLHILDPDPAFGSYLDNLTGKLKLPNLVLTTECIPAAIASDEKVLKTYYSCARFLQLNRVLSRYRTTIACFDVDTVFESSIDDMLTALQNKDAGLVQREPPDSPWLDIVANIVVANYTDMAFRYFAGVANFINHFGKHGGWFWHLDQIALHCVLKMMERYDVPPQIGWISQDNLPVWHIGHPNDFRLSETRFSRYQIDALNSQ